MNGILGKIASLKTLEKLELDNKKLILIILIFVIFLYADFNFLLKIQLAALKTSEPKIASLKKDFDNLRKDLVKMQELKKKQIEPGQKTLLRLKKIISSEQLTSLLQDLSNIANKNDIKIEQIKPSKEGQALKQGKIALIDKFQPVLITLDLTCDYHHLGKFINDIEDGENYVAIQGMKIKSQPNEYFKQKVNLVLKTYVKK